MLLNKTKNAYNRKGDKIIIAKDKKFLFFVVYSIILVFTIYLSYTFISTYIKEKQEFEQFKQTWQYRADTNFTQSIEIDEETGEQTVVYEISTPEQLAGMSIHSKNVKADSNQKVKYLLKQSLDLSGYNWSSVNSSSSNFDGDGFVISGLTSPFYDDLSATVECVTFENVTIKDTSGKYVGAIARKLLKGGKICGVNIMDGSVKGSCSTSSDENSCGGIVGYAAGGTISGCMNYASVSSSNNLGGIVGKSSISISNCRNYGDVRNISVNCKNMNVGGVVGSTSSSVSSCFNSGNITATPTESCSEVRVGGIVGSGSSISSCQNNGKIDGGANNDKTYVGGIAGYGSTISNCYNKGTSVTGTSRLITPTGGSGLVNYDTENGNTELSCLHVFRKVGILGYRDCWLKIWSGIYKIYKGYNELTKGKSLARTGANYTYDCYVGGIVGKGTGTVTSCYNKASTSGPQWSFTRHNVMTAEIWLNDISVDGKYIFRYWYIFDLKVNIPGNVSGINGRRSGSTVNCYSSDSCNLYTIDNELLSLSVGVDGNDKQFVVGDGDWKSKANSEAKETTIKLGYSGSRATFGSWHIGDLKSESWTATNVGYMDSGYNAKTKKLYCDAYVQTTQSGGYHDNVSTASSSTQYAFRFSNDFYETSYNTSTPTCSNLGFSWDYDSSKGGLYLIDLYW